MKKLTQGLVALVCVAVLGYFSSGTTNDAQARVVDSVSLDEAQTVKQSSAMASTQAVVARGCSQCNSIRDNDSKYLCRGKCSGKSYHCNSIRDNDKKYYCRGVVERKSYHCNSIRDNDLKQQCRAEAG